MTARHFVALGDVASVDSGPAFPSAMFGGPDEGIRLVRGDNIEPGALRWTRTKTWPTSALAGYEHLFLSPDDLILGMDRPVISAGLKLARARPADLPALLVQRVARIRPINIGRDYLYHWLSSPEFARHLMGHATGTQLPHVTLKSIRQYPVPRFGTEDERRIVEFVEDHLSRLDAADAYTDAAFAKLSGLRDRLVISAITGAESTQRVPPTLADVGTVDGDLPTLPSGWAWGRLGDVAEVVGGVTKDAKKQGDPSYVEVPYLRVANVQRGRLDLDHVSTIRVDPRKAESLRLQVGDVLLNEGGDRDKLARGWVWEGQVAGCIHQNHVFRARIHEPGLDPYFLSWTANTIGGRWAERNGKQSVNLASISLRVIKRMPVIIPAEGEAVARIEALSDRLAALERLASALAAARARGTILRRLLLAAAFSGELTASAMGLMAADDTVNDLARSGFAASASSEPTIATR